MNNEPEVKMVPIENLIPLKFPELPWTTEEAHTLWERSRQHGHHQVLYKCTQCSLEYILLTLRDKDDILQRHGLETGTLADFAEKITCPECGTKGKSFVAGARTQQGAIYEFQIQFGRKIE